MRRHPLALLLVLILADSTRADPPPPLAAPSEATRAPAPAPPPAGSRTTSPVTTAKLTAGLPKYIARPAPPADAASATVTPIDLREVDRPRNTIIRLPNFAEQKSALAPADPADTAPPPDGVIRLPRYEVRDRKVPPIKDRELLTPEGRLDLAFKRHPGLKIGNLFGLNRGPALMMLEEEFTLERRREMQDLVEFQQLAESLPPPQTDEVPATSPPAPAPSTTR